MRIWTLHPKQLDAKGLVALWRETLLAQKVLQGATQGYRNHPQLERFKAQANPVAAVAAYLSFVAEEAVRRGYNFSREKIAPHDVEIRMNCTRGQVLYEWEHLKNKLRERDATKYADALTIAEPDAHPIFRIIEGDVEPWEVRRAETSYES